MQTEILVHIGITQWRKWKGLLEEKRHTRALADEPRIEFSLRTIVEADYDKHTIAIRYLATDNHSTAIAIDTESASPGQKREPAKNRAVFK